MSPNITAPVQDPVTLEWTFPPTWTQDQTEEFVSLAGEVVAVTKSVDALQAKAAAALVDPAMLLEIKRGERDAAKRAAEQAKRIAEGAIAWLKAQAQFGDDVRRIDGEEGDVIIMRRMPEAAIEAANKMSADLTRNERSKLPASASEQAILEAQARALHAAIGAQQDAVIEHSAIAGLDVVESRRRLRALMAKYWGLWQRMITVRDEMIRGHRDDEGKGYAPS